MGPNYSISTACATSNFCILSAANHIIRGEAVSIPEMGGEASFCSYSLSIHIDFVPENLLSECRI